MSELSAQFAKESMACQSLDNDEILNVRWATEDPNPTSKVQEHERLEEMGRKAIQERMDPRIVDAMRAVRALEDGDVLDDEGPEIVDVSHERQSQNEEDEEEGQRETKRRRIEPSEPEEQPRAMGLLSADTVEGIKYFAEIRKRHELSAPTIVKQVAPPKPLTTTMALADYGSDED